MGKDIGAQFNDAVKEKLTAVQVKFDVTPEWYQAAKHAFMHASPLSLGISGIEMKSMYQKLIDGLKLNYYEFAIVNNNIEGRTPNELINVEADYYDIMTQTADYADKWNSFVADVHQEVLAQLALGPDGRPLNEKRAVQGLTSVPKGQA